MFIDFPIARHVCYPSDLTSKKGIAVFQPTASFKENLQLMPAIEGVARIDIIDLTGSVVDSIPNQPGKQGSLVVYQYLHQNFIALNAEAAERGLAIFAEHTADAQNRPGAHPNIDRLLEIVEGSDPLEIRIVKD